MIKSEPILEKAFNLLPNLGATVTTPDGFKPYYDYGNEFHLRKVLQLNKQKSYPLIYQTTNSSTQNSKENTVTFNTIRFVLAVENVKTDQLNKDRWLGSTYDDILFPLVENIETLFTKGNIFLWEGEYDMTTFPNYGSDSNTNEPKPVAIWDAILLEVSNLTIYGDRCLQKTIKF